MAILFSLSLESSYKRGIRNPDVQIMISMFYTITTILTWQLWFLHSLMICHFLAVMLGNNLLQSLCSLISQKENMDFMIAHWENQVYSHGLNKMLLTTACWYLMKHMIGYSWSLSFQQNLPKHITEWMYKLTISFLHKTLRNSQHLVLSPTEDVLNRNF